jgi:uridine kinase/ribulose-5-phosphate 4-epimerase/fuculose-1-phosphate aldolase
MTYLICISGSSGVGKTTLAQLMYLIHGTQTSCILSGDDLHKWERSHPMWNTYTHLNPEANDLDKGHDHIRKLKLGNSITRQMYNHDTGKFDTEVTVQPKSVLIYEGLHALYYDPTTQLADLSIYVDTNEELKTEWKLRRDIQKRGYTEKQVKDMIRRRSADEQRFISPQKSKADVMVKFVKNEDSEIDLEYISINGKGEELFERVKRYYDDIRSFINGCKKLSLEPSLTQGRGGNVSVKTQEGLLITSSGSKMADINLHHGFCLCEEREFFKTYSSEIQYSIVLEESIKIGEGRPSMETGFHANLPHRAIVHTHPLHLNAILCSNEAKAIIKGLFKDLSYEFVEYITPGMKLVNRLSESSKSIIFLENHGLIVGSDTVQEAYALTDWINSKCKNWLGNHLESLVDMESTKEQKISPLFPDCAVFPIEMASTNAYIFALMTSACLTPKYLNEQNIQELTNMGLEKYRVNLNKGCRYENCDSNGGNR